MSSLITRCPACATMFKVVPDQLRVSDGWVRCGQCNEVFDANSNLQARAETATHSNMVPLSQDPRPEPPPPPPPPSPVESVPPVGSKVAPPVAQTAAKARVDVKAAAMLAEEVPSAAQITADVDGIAPQPAATPFLDVIPRSRPIEPVPEEIVVAPRPATLGEQRSSVLRGEKPRRVGKETATQNTQEPSQHTFMVNRSVSATWDRPWVRAGLWLVGLTLGVGLMVQVVVQERDRIAATEPIALRLLEPLCSALGCKIAPLLQIESIVIDSSSFAKTRADVYRLSFTLKNTAPTAVATPSMELTLTDMQDQAVIRRVFVATEFGRQQTMLPGTELVATLPVSVKSGVSGAKISGYRLLSFYP